MFAHRFLHFVLVLALAAPAAAGSPAWSQEKSEALTTDSASAQPVSLAARRPKIGLALGGGGTRGVAHVAVLKVLRDEGIPIDYVAGTSIGAIVGGLFCAGVPLETIEEKLVDRSLMKSFMTMPLALRLALSPVIVIPRLFYHPYDGLYKGDRFRNYLNKSVKEYKCDIEDFKIPFRAVAVNLIDGKAYSISSGNLGFAVQASSAVPQLRKPVQIGDKLFVDGGVVANLPVEQVREMGADVVIAVNVDERVETVPLSDFRKIGSVAKRLLMLQLAHVDAPQMDKADIIIHPKTDGIGLISTNVDDAKKALEEGYKAAREKMPEIKAKLSAMGLAEAKAGGSSQEPERP